MPKRKKRKFILKAKVMPKLKIKTKPTYSEDFRCSAKGCKRPVAELWSFGGFLPYTDPKYMDRDFCKYHFDDAIQKMDRQCKVKS